MGPIDPPLIPQLQISLEVRQQIGGRHGPAREEVAGHPAVVKVVRRVAVAQDVDEELAVWFEGVGELGQEEVVVFHVFEELGLSTRFGLWQKGTYLDRYDAVKGLGGEFVSGDVAGDDGDVFEVALLCQSFDVFPLCS